ncbi:MAG: methyltransferase [Pseudomonadota bacterium]
MTRLTILLTAASALTLAACETQSGALEAEPAIAAAPPAEAAETAATDAVEVAEETADDMAEEMASDMAKPAMTSAEKLDVILATQPADVQARYDQRNPAQTLAFFGIKPGMTVAEALPGGGWYTKILLPYVGPEGKVVGAQYPDAIWSRFNFGEEWAQEQTEASANWTTTAAEWDIDGAADIGAYQMTSAPDDMAASLDAVLFIRALHNLHRFNGDTGWFDDTVAETFALLKPGGIVGVVQHQAPETNPDEWADGNAGYLKQSRVVEAFEAAGFVLEATTDVNANPADMPTTDDFVWRLPPSLASTEEGTPEREAMEAIGESNRMTLRFRKPA